MPYDPETWNFGKCLTFYGQLKVIPLIAICVVISLKKFAAIFKSGLFAARVPGGSWQKYAAVAYDLSDSAKICL